MRRRPSDFEVPWTSLGKISRETLWRELRELCNFDGGLILEVGAGHERNLDRGFFSGRFTQWLTVDLDRAARPDVAGSVFALPFRDGLFDTIVSTQTLEHVPDPDAALGEIGRVIRPGGRLVLSAPQTWGIHMEPYDFFRFTRYGLEAMLTRAGFAVEQVRPCGSYFAALGLILAHGAFHLGLHARHSRVRRFWRRTGIVWINRTFLRLDRRYGRLSGGYVINWAVLARRN